MNTKVGIPGTISRISLFIIVAILVVTAVAKIVATGTNEPILNMPDPILLLDTRMVLIVAAIVETVVVLFLLRTPDDGNKQIVLITLLLTLIIYRVGWLIAGVKEPCPCLGTGYRWWPWMDKNVSSVSLALFLILSAMIAVNFFCWVLSARLSKQNE